MRKFFFLILMLLCVATYAQHPAADLKANKAKSAVMKAFGGIKAIKGISQFSYTIHKTTFGPDTTFTRTTYLLDLNQQHVQETLINNADTITKWIGTDGAWLLQNGEQTTLPNHETDRLKRVFLTNFIPMLRNDSLVYTYKQQTIYKGRKADVVQVFTPQKKALIMDLFIDAKKGTILTSSRPDPKTGEYLYFADELDYKSIGKGLIFPLVYQVWVADKLVTEGRFEDVVVK